jgi:hypothetical protein
VSLIPSESSHFPDLIGQRHGYRNPNARRPSLKRSQREAPAPPASPAISKKPDENKDRLKPQEGIIPTDGASNTAEQLELVPQNPPAETVGPSHTPLPILPQRSVALTRSKIQTQEVAKIQTEEVAKPRPATRPRTPIRGLVVAHPTPVIRQKPSLPSLQSRDRVKLVRFIACEIIATGVLIWAMKFGFSHPSSNDSVSLFFKILAIAAAIGAAIVPVIFYGLPAMLLRSER